MTKVIFKRYFSTEKNSGKVPRFEPATLIFQVKMDNAEEAAAFGIDFIPSLVYFENSIPHLFEGNLRNDNEVLGWLLHQVGLGSTLFKRFSVGLRRIA